MINFIPKHQYLNIVIVMANVSILLKAPLCHRAISMALIVQTLIIMPLVFIFLAWLITRCFVLISFMYLYILHSKFPTANPKPNTSVYTNQIRSGHTCS